MKKLFFVFVVLLFTAGFASKVSAQVTKSNNAGGEILTPINLVVDLPLEFGKLAVLATGGNVSITADGANTVTKTASVTLVSGGDDRTAAKYTVSGAGGYSYDIDAPSTITVSNGTETMDITTNVKSVSTTSSTGGTLDGTSGTDIIYVGGTLTIPAGQAAGRYTNSYNVTVNYN